MFRKLIPATVIAFMMMNCSFVFGQSNIIGGGIFGDSALAAQLGQPYIAANFYVPWGITSNMSTGSGSTGSIRCVQGYFKGIATLDVLGTRVTTAVAAGNFQLAIYAISPTTGLPTGSALAQTGSLSTTSTGNVQGTVNTGTPVQLGSAAALLTSYAFCFNVDATATSTANFNFTQTNLIAFGQEDGASSANNLFPGSGTTNTSYSYTQTFGTWPSLTAVSPTSINTFGSLVPYMHFSSVP